MAGWNGKEVPVGVDGGGCVTVVEAVFDEHLLEVMGGDGGQLNRELGAIQFWRATIVRFEFGSIQGQQDVGGLHFGVVAFDMVHGRHA